MSHFLPSWSVFSVPPKFPVILTFLLMSYLAWSSCLQPGHPLEVTFQFSKASTVFSLLWEWVTWSQSLSQTSVQQMHLSLSIHLMLTSECFKKYPEGKEQKLYSIFNHGFTKYHFTVCIPAGYCLVVNFDAVVTKWIVYFYVTQ